jgi:hypothetical protein
MATRQIIKPAKSPAVVGPVRVGDLVLRGANRKTITKEWTVEGRKF